MSLKRLLSNAIIKNLKKLDITLTEEEVLAEEATTTIAEVMGFAEKIIKPDTPQLSEQQFKDMYKVICVTQNNEGIKKQFGEDLYNEFYNNRQTYVRKYKHLIGKILSEVQKELSEQIID